MIWLCIPGIWIVYEILYDVSWRWRRPGVTLSPQPRPEPNAFAYFRKAGALLVDEDLVADLAAESISAVDPDQLLIVVERNRPALDKLLEGLFFESADDSPKVFEGMEPKSYLRTLNKLLLLESRMYHLALDEDRSANSLADALVFGSKVGRDGMIIGALVGFAISHVIRTEIWNRFEMLSRRALQTFLDSLTSTLHESDTLQEVYESEARWLMAALDDLFSKPDWRNKHGYVGSTASRPKKMLMNAVGRILGKQGIRNEELSFPAAGIRDAHKPYHRGSMHRLSAIDWLLSPGTEFVYDGFRFAYTRNRAFAMLLQAAVAARIYFLDNNRYPISWEEMIPEYLAERPVDPFDPARATLRLLTTLTGWTIFSVGPDRIDDGGKSIAGVAEMEATGDIVVRLGAPPGKTLKLVTELEHRNSYQRRYSSMKA